MQADLIPWKRSSGRSSGQREKSDCSGKAGMVSGGDDLIRNGWRATGSEFGVTGDRMVKKTVREMKDGACRNIAGSMETENKGVREGVEEML